MRLRDWLKRTETYSTSGQSRPYYSTREKVVEWYLYRRGWYFQ